MKHKKDKRHDFKYTHYKEGELIHLKIYDSTSQIVYKRSFRTDDKEAIYNLLTVLEKFCDFSVYDLIRQKLKIGEWF